MSVQTLTAFHVVTRAVEASSGSSCIRQRSARSQKATAPSSIDRTTNPQRHSRSAAPKSFQFTPRKEKYRRTAATAIQLPY